MLRLDERSVHGYLTTATTRVTTRTFPGSCRTRCCSQGSLVALTRRVCRAYGAFAPYVRRP